MSCEHHLKTDSCYWTPQTKTQGGGSQGAYVSPLESSINLVAAKRGFGGEHQALRLKEAITRICVFMTQNDVKKHSACTCSCIVMVFFHVFYIPLVVNAFIFLPSTPLGLSKAQFATLVVAQAADQGEAQVVAIHMRACLVVQIHLEDVEPHLQSSHFPMFAPPSVVKVYL